MKTAKEILKQHCPSMDTLFLDTQGREFRQRIFDAMEEYAIEAIKHDRERVKELLPDEELDWVDFHDFSLGVESKPTEYKKEIDNLPIELK